MASSNVCWGVEVGAGAVKALKLAREGDALKVLEFVEVAHPRPLSAPDVDEADAIRLAVGTLASQYSMAGDAIAISAPGQAGFVRFAKLPPTEPKQVPNVVKFEAAQQIPFPLEDVEWAYQTFVGEDDPDIEVGIFAITRERVMDRLAVWEEMKLEPGMLALSPIAAFNAVAFDQGFADDTPGTVILDIGTTATDLIVVDHGRVWIRTFPMGGHNFTEALVSAFKIDYGKAERLKRPLAVSMTFCRKRRNIRKRCSMVSISLSYSRFSSMKVIPLIIIRLVGCSMCSQAVSTLDIGSLISSSCMFLNS